MTRAWLGGLVGTVLISLMFGGERDQAVISARVDAVVAIIMRALRPDA